MASTEPRAWTFPIPQELVDGFVEIINEEIAARKGTVSDDALIQAGITAGMELNNTPGDFTTVTVSFHPDRLREKFRVALDAELRALE